MSAPCLGENALPHPCIRWSHGATEQIDAGTTLGDIARSTPSIYLVEIPPVGGTPPPNRQVTHRRLSYVLESGKKYLVKGDKMMPDNPSETMSQLVAQLQVEIGQLKERISALEKEKERSLGVRGRDRKRLSNNHEKLIPMKELSAPSSTGSSPAISPLPSPPSRPQTRQKIIEEIIQGEKDYLENLGFLDTIFYQAFLANTKTVPGLTTTLVEELFGELPTIMRVNSSFLSRLQAQVRDSESPPIGKLFIELCESLKSYTTYISGYDERIKTLKRTKQNLKFDHWLRDLESANSTVLNKRTLNDILIHPVKRVPQYLILIQRLLKYTDEDHPDYQNLVQAEKECHATAQHFEEKSQNVLNARVVLTVMNSFRTPKKFADLDCLNPDRVLVFEQEGLKASIPSTKATTFRVCAFSDCLLFLSKSKKLGIIQSGECPWVLRACIYPEDVIDVARRGGTNTLELSYLRKGEALTTSLFLEDSTLNQWKTYLMERASITQVRAKVSNPALRRSRSVGKIGRCSRDEINASPTDKSNLSSPKSPKKSGTPMLKRRPTLSGILHRPISELGEASPSFGRRKSCRFATPEKDNGKNERPDRNLLKRSNSETDFKEMLSQQLSVGGRK